MPPTPTVRGILETSGISTGILVVDVTSVCQGSPVLLCYISTVGDVAPGDVASITGGGVTGFTEIARTSSTSAPRPIIAWKLDGVLDGTDITVEFGVNISECALYLIDWAGAKKSKPFIHVLQTSSLPNLSARTIHHQRRVHSSNAICGFLINGYNNSPPTADEGTQLEAFNFGTGIAGGQVVWKSSDFTNFKIDWSWGGVASNLAVVFEVQDPASDDGGTVTYFDTGLRTADSGPHNDVSGSVTTFAFTPEAGDVIILDIIGERNPPIQPNSVQDSLSNVYTEVGHVDDPGGIHRLWRYARRYVTSPGSIQVTFDLSSLAGSVWQLVTLRGTQGSTNTDYGGELITSTAGAGTSLVLTLSNLRSHSGVLATFTRDSSTEDFTLDEGWVTPDLMTENRVGFGFETESMVMAWLGGNEDSSASVTTGSAGNLSGIAQEIYGIPQETTYFGRSVNPADNGSLSAEMVTITPPGSMITGDLVLMMGLFRDQSGTVNWQISNAGGQQWSTVGDQLVGFGCTLRRWWCQFDGTWDNNLLTANQASIETDTTGWVAANANTTISQQAPTSPPDGTSALRMRSAASGSVQADISPALASGVGGRTYTARAAFRAATIGHSIEIDIYFLNENQQFLTGSGFTLGTDSTTGWTVLSVTKKAPTGTRYIYVLVLAITTGANEDHFVDAISVHEGSSSDFYLPSSVDPIIDSNFGSADAITGAMFVFRPSVSAIGWALDSQTFSFLTDTTDPYDLTFPSQPVKGNNEVVFVEWHQDVLHTMALQTEGWVNPAAETQWRNTAGSDLLLSAAHKVQNVGSSGDVTNRADSGASQGATYMSFFEVTKNVPVISKQKRLVRASRW